MSPAAELPVVMTAQGAAALPLAADRKRIPQAVRFNVLRRDNFACRYCGRQSPTVTLHLDHVKPHSKGGSDTEDNLVTACDDCNFGKRDKILSNAPSSAKTTNSLVGLFGHELLPDGRINRQFLIVRDIGDHCIAQLFSAFDGCPTNCEAFEKYALIGDQFKLYLDEEVWRESAKQDWSRYNGRG